MSDSSDPQAGAPPVTTPSLHSADGKKGTRSTGGGPLQWEAPGIGEAARLFPNYEILALLGRGGMGAVYKARQVALDRVVAIKLLPLDVSADRDFAERFVREAQTMAKLSHPNIVTVFDFGTTGEGHLFFVMEFVEGANLHSIIHEVGLGPDQALWLAGEICAALSYAHRKGVVHRDIKPANVMVNGESHVKVADFGLARLTDVSPQVHGMTMTGIIMGTPDYMAPEQKRGVHVDHRADIFSLGVMLYEMLCREVPQGAFDLPSRRTDCDPRIDAIVVKAMQQSPERRYQSAEEMESAVEAARKPQAAGRRPQAAAPVPQGGTAAKKPARSVPAPSVAPVPAAPKNRVLLYAGIAVIALGASVAGTMALQKATPKTAGERTARREAPTEEQPEAKPPQSKPARAKPKTTPIAATLPEQPAPIESERPSSGASVAATPPEQPLPLPPDVAQPAPASEPATPAAPAAAISQTATEKWIAEQEPKWQAAFTAEVTVPFEKAATELGKQYRTTLDTQLATAQRAGQLETALAFRAEIQRLTATGALGEDDATTPPGIKTIRAAFRKNLAVLETDRATRAKAVHARHDAILAQNQTLLTQNQRLDEALRLKAKRDELAASWLKLMATVAPENPGVAPENPGVATTPTAPQPTPRVRRPPGGNFPSPSSTRLFIPAEEIGNRTVGDTVHVKGKIKKTYGPSLGRPDRYYVVLEPDVVCEFPVEKDLRFELSGVFKGSGMILQTGTELTVKGTYDGKGSTGLVKGHMLRGCEVTHTPLTPRHRSPF